MIFLLFVSLLSYIFLINNVNSQSCGNGASNVCTVDIVFVMDSSGSVNSGTEWPQSVSFVNGVIDQLGRPSNVGIIEFDHDVNTIYGLCDSQDSCPNIQSALSSYPKDGGGTDIALGVEVGKTMLNDCDDPDKDNILVLITDGVSNAGTSDPCNIDLTGITTYVVKVGTANPAIDCLVENTETDIFDVANFGDIMEFGDSLTAKICNPCDVPGLEYCDNDPCDCADVENCQVCNQGSGCGQCKQGFFKLSYDSQCYACEDVFGSGCMFCQDFSGCGQCKDGYQRVLLYPKEECDFQADVYGCKRKGTINDCSEDIIIGIDDSGSIDNEEFAIEQNFAINLIDLIKDNSNIGVYEFDTTSEQVEPLGSGDAQSAQIAIANIVRSGGGTNFVELIDDAIAEFPSGAADKADVLVIISDGQPFPDPCSDTYDRGQALIDAGVNVVIVGVGNGFVPTSSRITCLVDFDSSRIIPVEEFTDDAFNEILTEVALKVCDFQCPNGETDSTGYVDGYGCPIPCDEDNPNAPCQCCDLCFCEICHSPEGCDECLPGFFKKNYNYPCIDCQTYDPGCQFCQDFNGCGQCKYGYYRYYDSTCGLWKCNSYW